MGSVKNYRDLVVWQKSMELVAAIYTISKTFPKEELYGITSQLRRSSVSVPSNIAEGYGRHSTNDYVRFLRISIGSLFELQTLIEIANNLEYMNKDQFADYYSKSREIERMLSSLIRKVEDR